MTSNDYIQSVKLTNFKLWPRKETQHLNITSDELERLLKHAFEKGEESGKASKSLFAQIFE